MSSSESTSGAQGGSIGSNNGGGVPWYVWVIGAVAVIGGAVYFLSGRKGK